MKFLGSVNKIVCVKVSAFEETICKAPIVIIDGNVEVEVIHYCIDLCKKHSIPGT